jgi:hypothetical protein
MTPTPRHTEGCPGAVACDLAREQYALTADEQAIYIADLEVSRDTYRDLLRHALAGWRVTLVERDRARAECGRLREEYRALRAAVIAAGAGRAA